MTKRKNVLLIFLTLLTSLSLVGCGRQKTDGDQWPRIKAEKKVIVGLDDTFVPMGFQNKSGQIVGFDVDLAKAVFDLYGIKVDFQPIDWSMKENELQNQTIDLIWNGYSRTDERAQKVLFSDSYLRNGQVIVALKKSGIKSFQDLKGKVVGLQNGSSGYDRFEKQPKILKDLVKNHEPVLYDGFNEAFMDLNAGRIDGLLIDRGYATYYLSHESNPSDYSVISGGFKPESFAVGLRKSDRELANKINEGLKILKKNGKLAEISKKWFGQDLERQQKN
ncbi:amino acid ABC transporter substrate-binding protein [Xylocopilactobacillus apicola]|uniref:Glutamine ABC transporter substrate-binding protein n=1 Tax=Xylocopilactobacillus apicola TaxID=2932184 RepID=A0AAU9DQ85_9LACO|nr:amino acid ABC transporter substrate-binding protein [Xylocopilactobacillus apicola]BDR59367.1 glutamine ABC transporter substrate-binding protein [Xylocopilactobacillus apicola]